MSVCEIAGVENPLCKLGSAAKGAVGDAVGGVTSGALQNMADAITQALGQTIKSLGTIWVSVPTPNLSESGTVGFLHDSLYFYMAAFAVFALILAGARMAWEGRGEPGREAMKAMITLTVVTGTGLATLSLAVQAGDGFSTWILDRSTGGRSFGENITLMFGAATGAGANPLGVMLIIVLGLFALIASLAQIALMFVRGVMLVLLAGILPLSAAATNTDFGRQWFRKTLGWLVAFVLYKPAAAIVYATAFRLTASDVQEDGLLTLLSGLTMMILALFALPALMRLVVPSSTDASGSGEMQSIKSGAVGSMPTGAKSVPPVGSSSAGSVGSSMPSGAATTGVSASGAGAASAGAAAAGPAGAALVGAEVAKRGLANTSQAIGESPQGSAGTQ